MKNLKKLFVLLIIFFITAFSLSAQVVSVYDECNLLSDNEKNLLEEQASFVSKNHSIAVYITVVDDMELYGYYNIEEFTEFWYDEKQLGWPGTGDAVMLCLSMADRSYDFFAHGDICNAAFTDYGKDILIRDYVIPSLRQNDWYNAFASFIDRLDPYMCSYEQGTPIDVPPEVPREPNPFLDAILAFFVSLFPGLASCKKQKRQLNNVLPATNANQYINPANLVLSVNEDLFTHETSSRVYVSTTSSGGGARTGGGTTISSHGSSHSSGHF